MARRWVRLIKNQSKSEQYERRCKKLRLVVGFRYDPPWKAKSGLDSLTDTFRIMAHGARDPQENCDRQEEYRRFVEKFRGEIEGKINRMADLGLHPTRIDGQGLISLLYPLFNRRSTKG